MTTIVPRNDPTVSLLHDPHREIDERAEPNAVAARRPTPLRVAPPATARAGELHVTPSQVQPPPKDFFGSLIRQILGKVAAPRGYGDASRSVQVPGGLPFSGATAPVTKASSAATVKASSTSKSTSTSSKSTSTSSKSTSTSSKSASTSSKSTSSSSKTTAKDLAFLSDKNLSIEEKLFRFISLMTKKEDQELVDAMKSYETRRTASKTSSSSGSGAGASVSDVPITASIASDSKPSGGGGGGFLGSLMGSIGSAVGAVSSVVKEVGGPLLGAAATAFGMPELAPVASMAGGALAGFVADQTLGRLKPESGSTSSGTAKASGTSAKASSSSAKSSTSSSSSSSGTSGDFDEKLEMMNLQRLVEKQSAMFTALSNVMKSIHEAQMSAVQNIR